MIRIEINTDNAASNDSNELSVVARMLRDIADRVESGSLETCSERVEPLDVKPIKGV